MSVFTLCVLAALAVHVQCVREHAVEEEIALADLASLAEVATKDVSCYGCMCQKKGQEKKEVCDHVWSEKDTAEQACVQTLGTLSQKGATGVSVLHDASECALKAQTPEAKDVAEDVVATGEVGIDSAKQSAQEVKKTEVVNKEVTDDSAEEVKKDVKKAEKDDSADVGVDGEVTNDSAEKVKKDVKKTEKDDAAVVVDDKEVTDGSAEKVKKDVKKTEKDDSADVGVDGEVTDDSAEEATGKNTEKSDVADEKTEKDSKSSATRVLSGSPWTWVFALAFFLAGRT